MKNNLPRISIVTPSFNQAPFLEETLRSILDQGYPDLETLVLDGGSTDGSVEILRRYSPQLSYWRSEKDSGQSAALREGFARATGEVFAWLNSDDYYEPGALRAVGEAFANNPQADIVVGDLRFVDVHGKRLYLGHLVPSLKIIAYESSFPAQQSLFWRRSIYQEAGGIDASYQFAMDLDLLVRMMLAGARFVKLRQTLANFRQHEGAKSSRLQEVCAVEVRRTLEKHGLVSGGPIERKLKRWVYRGLRFARDPRCIAGAAERIWRGVPTLEG